MRYFLRCTLTGKAVSRHYRTEAQAWAAAGDGEYLVVEDDDLMGRREFPWPQPTGLGARQQLPHDRYWEQHYRFDLARLERAFHAAG